MVIAHNVPDATYFLLRDAVECRELGPDFYDKLHQAQLVVYHAKRLAELGVAVITAHHALAA